MLPRLRLPASQWPIEVASTASLIMPLALSARFSTTPRVSLAAPKKKSNPQAIHNLPSKGKKSLNIKKAAPEKKPRVPLEQKRALQKRIVLSNTNAQQVAWLRDLSKENMCKEGVMGKVYGLQETVVDALRLVNAFKVGQDWAAYRRPACLIRREAWELGKMMEGISTHQFGDNEAASRAQTVKRVIYGPRRAGKSVLMLQVMAMAFLRGWIVINIPEARELTDASSGYAPIPDTDPREYTQNSLTASIIQRTIDANKTQFFAMKLSQMYDIPVRNEPNMTLYEFGRIATLNSDLAWPIFRALWNEINLQNSPKTEKFGRRPPILLCADNISHLFVPTKYQELDNEGNLSSIHSYDMVLPKLVIDCITGMQSFGNGGIVLGATSGTDKVTCHPLDVGIALAESKMKTPNAPASLSDLWNPYDRIDRRVLNSMMDLEVLKLAGVSKDEAREIIEYWAHNGLVRERVKDNWVSERWTMSGGGVMGELEKAVVHMRF